MSKAFIKAKEKYNAVINDAGRGDRYCRNNRYGVGKPVGGDLANHARLPQRRRSSAASDLSMVPTNSAESLPGLTVMHKIAFAQMQRRRSSTASSMEMMTDGTKADVQDAMKKSG